MEKNATLKRRNPQWVCQLAVLVLATIAKTGSALVCDEVVYVKYGKRAVIPCTCEPGFDIVSWYRDKDFTSNQPPFIYLDASGKNGPGYDSHQYDLDQNGSLIIYNVSLSDDDCFMVTAVKFNSERRSVQREVHVTVISGPHDPVYPVVNGFIYQQHVYMDVNRKGPLTCSLYHVHPVVNLTWNVLDPSHKDKIQVFDVAVRNTLNDDGTFNVFLDSHYIVEDLSLRRIAIQCEVTDEISEYFAETTKVELLFPTVFFIPVFPTVNGFTNQQHVYLDTDRKGRLNCSKRNVIPSAHLSWEVVDPVLKQKITFQSETNRSRNMDGTVDIFLTSEFSVEDDRLERITIQCRVLGVAEDGYPNVTTVDLLFPDAPPVPPAPPVPVIEGCYNKQDGCVLRMPRKGELACGVMKSQQQVDLRWKCDEDFFILKEDKKVIKNHSNVFDVSIFTPYDISVEVLDLVTIQCEVIGWVGEAPSAAKVSLILEKAAEPGLELKTTVLLVLMAVQLVLICCVSFVINTRMRRMRENIKILDTLLRNNSSGGTGRSSRDQNFGLELHCPAETSGESYIVQESVACGDQQETAKLMGFTQNGNTGSSDSDSGKGSGSDSGLDHKAKPLLSESGREVSTDSRGNKDFRHTKKDRLVKTILKVFQLLYEKYLSDEREIEDTVAIINEEEDKME